MFNIFNKFKLYLIINLLFILNLQSSTLLNDLGITNKNDLPTVLKPLKKLKGFNLPDDINDLEIKNLKIFYTLDKVMQIKGDYEFLGTTGTAIINKKKAKTVGEGGFLIQLSTDTVIKPSDIKLPASLSIPKNIDAILNNFNIKNTKITISTYDYTNPEFGLFISKGLNYSATISIKKAKKPNNWSKILHKILPQENDYNEFTLFGNIGPKSNLGIHVPTSIKIGNRLVFTGAKIKFALPSSIYLKGAMKLSVPNQKDKLSLSGTLAINLSQGFDEKTKNKIPKLESSISASMLGRWENPFGIEGFSLEDVAATLGVSILPLTTVSKLGFTGIFNLPHNKKIEMSGMAGKEDVVLKGSFNGKLMLKDLLLIPDTKNFDFDKIKKAIPDISITKLLFYFAPFPTKIGDIVFNQGFSAAGQMLLPGNKWVDIEIKITSSGIKAKTSIPEINIGPLQITGAGPDKEWDTDDDGVILDFEFSNENQYFYLSGLIDLIILSALTEVNLNKDEIFFHTTTKLLDKYEIEIFGKAKTNKPEDFLIKLKYSDDFKEEMKIPFISLIKKSIEPINSFIGNNYKKTKNQLNEYKNELQKIKNTKSIEFQVLEYKITRSEKYLSKIIKLTNSKTMFSIEKISCEFSLKEIKKANTPKIDLNIKYIIADEQYEKTKKIIVDLANQASFLESIKTGVVDLITKKLNKEGISI